MEAGSNNDNDKVRTSNPGPFNANTVNFRQNHKTIPNSAVVIGTSSVSSLLHRNSSSPPTLKKIMSKNFNNTIYPTTYPSNLAELQLYRVMQNASLLYYYDTLLEMGGDDVQQLCDAGEEEFLEIMSLVGMAAKPLHVRRFQKSLQEWVNNSTKFKAPLMAGEDFELELSSPRVSSNHGTHLIDNNEISKPIYSPTSGENYALLPATSPGLSLSKRPYSPFDGSSCPPSSSSSPGCSSTSLQLTPTLVDSQINKLVYAAERLSKQLPQFEPKCYNNKKKMSKELELVMMMPENDPRRMDEIRKYAAIYGRFDCKRRPEKPLTLHEVSVNEAAAQICRFMPALLTRRDELFPLARQVVKDAGCHYSKSQVSSTYTHKNSGNDKESTSESPLGISQSTSEITNLELEEGSAKRAKLETSESQDSLVTQVSRNKVRFNSDAIQVWLMQMKLMNREGMFCDLPIPYAKAAIDAILAMLLINLSEDENLYMEENNYSQSTTDEQIELENEDTNQPQVIAVSGDNIIAVANPALTMSSTIFVTERERNKSKN